MLEEVGSEIRRIAETVGAACVGVGRRGPVGSGVVVAPGQIVTNAHNVGERGRTITFVDGRRVVGEPSGIDPANDLAVLEVDTGEVEPVARGDLGGISIGSPVVALANPGGRGLRVTFGFVSGMERSFRGPRGRRLGGALEHTAPLLPGSSGGPLVDLKGRLIGVNTHRLGDGFYLALPAGAPMNTRLEALGRGEERRPARLGVAVVPNFVARRMRGAVGLPETEGLLVRGVEEGSPAERAGVRQGDVLTALDGRAIVEIDDLYAALDEIETGSEVELHVMRGVDDVVLTLIPERG